MRYFTYLLTLGALAVAAFAVTKNDAASIDMLRKALLQLEKDLRKDLADQQKWTKTDKQEESVYLINKYKEFGDQMDKQFPQDEEVYLTSLDNLWLWTRTQNEMWIVNSMYNMFRYMQYKTDELNATIDFAKNNIQQSDAGIPGPLGRIAYMIVKEKLFIAACQEAVKRMCYDTQSPQHLLYKLYNAVTLTEIKGYTMIQFSYMLLSLQNEFNTDSKFNKDVQMLKHQYAIRVFETLKAVKIAMAFAPRSLWKCDPLEHQEDETYIELKQLFQGYIVNEIDLNSGRSCWHNCDYYKNTEVYGCYENHFCTSQFQCNGKVLNCEYIDSDVWICPSVRNSSRRYEYIEYENGLHYGNINTCPRKTIKFESWYQWIFFQHCSYCFCYCDDEHLNLDRYISLRSVVADISNNKVITGLRLKKINQVIYIQIQVGQLLPYGAIDTSIEWQSVDDFSIKDHRVKNGVDYHTIKWEERALNLDDIISSQNHLLTGIRFQVVNSRLSLKIMVTPFNFSSGLLLKFKTRSLWHGNDVTNRTELKYIKPDIPIRDYMPNLPDSGRNQYLNFAPTDRWKDVAQSTIPFFDIQPIITNPPMPLAGAGIFHKGRNNSGGFVALKLISYNFAPHLQADLPPAPPIF